MTLTNRLVPALLAGLLVLGAGGCNTDRTEEETGVPGDGIDAPEGAEPEGGIGTEPAEDEGATGGDEDPIDGGDDGGEG